MEMRKLILISVVTLVCCSGVLDVVHGFTYEDHEIVTEQGKEAMFERWRSHHKMEAISEQEKMKQYSAFKANLETVHKTNKANLSFKLEMNRFAGMTNEELQSKYTGLKIAPSQLHTAKKECITGPADNWPFPFKYRNVTDVPPKMDWRCHKAVTRVKNQGGCGSCYAFPAVDAVEGLHAIKNKELIELSPKEILDCAKIGGCNGGVTQYAFKYMAENGGLTTEKNYPYKPEEETCNLQKEKDIAVQIHGYEEVPKSEGDHHLLKAVAHQPVAVASSWGDNLALYKEGIVSGPCSTHVQHAILAVGYDTAPDGTKYWIMKNSWSENYGEKGYVRMLRGIPDKDGFCGVAAHASYPILESDSGKHSDDSDAVVRTTEEL